MIRNIRNIFQSMLRLLVLLAFVAFNIQYPQTLNWTTPQIKMCYNDSLVVTLSFLCEQRLNKIPLHQIY